MKKYFDLKILKRNFNFRYNRNFCSKNNNDGQNPSNTSIPTQNVSFMKANDIKSFGRKFKEDEVKQYLDPFGFLNANEYKEVKSSIETNSKSEDNNNTAITTNKANTEQLKKLEEIEKIEDPVKKADEKSKHMPKEFGYKYRGKEPTRYGDWEIKGKCVDF